MYFKIKNTKEKLKNKGFSLVELIVVVGIFTVITSVVIFNYGKFSSNLIVTNLAYEAALAVRQAQVYGISVKKTLTQEAGQTGFDSAYGVWFEKGSPTQDFYLFSDKDADNIYDVGNENEESFSMNGSNQISKFCVTSSEGAICSASGIDSMSIIFKRPEPNAKIHAFLSSSEVIRAFTKAEIMFTSGRGDKTARMTITNTGQISVDSCNKPAGDPNPCP